MIFKGELDFHDYDTGMFDVCMYYIFSQGQHCVRVWFGTIDDGDFGSWTACKSKEKALALLEKVKNKFEEITTLPTQEELNDDFKELGVYFCNE